MRKFNNKNECGSEEGKRPATAPKGGRAKSAGKKTYNKRKSFDRQDDETQDFHSPISKENDWRWYAQNEQLLRDTASFPYSWPLGNPLTLFPTEAEGNGSTVPGVMAIHISPAIGYAEADSVAPVNVAARNVYTFVRHQNSGHVNYDAPDLMLYLLAMDSCYSYIAWLKRIYGVMMTFSYTNRYYPQAVVTAMEVDFDDIHTHLADFRAFINSLAVRVGSMAIPANMSYMARHMWMYSGLYYDTPQDKAQTYLYQPTGFYQFNLNPESSAGELVFKPLSKSVSETDFEHRFSHTSEELALLKFADLVAYGEQLLRPVLQSEDMNIMSGDILKAYLPANIYKIDMINESYTVLPAYVEEVLDQINNLRFIGFPIGDRAQTVFTGVTGKAAGNVVQDATKGYLESNPKYFCWNNMPATYAAEKIPNRVFIPYNANVMINFQHGDINPANTMVASRLANIVSGRPEINEKAGYAFSDVETVGSEVANYGVVYRYTKDMSRGMLLIATEAIFTAINTQVSDSAMTTPTQITAMLSKNMQALARAAMFTVFDRHPRIAQFAISTIEDSGVIKDYASAFAGFLGDVNYYALLDAEALKRLATTALLSEFDVTQYGRKA